MELSSSAGAEAVTDGLLPFGSCPSPEQNSRQASHGWRSSDRLGATARLSRRSHRSATTLPSIQRVRVSASNAAIAIRVAIATFGLRRMLVRTKLPEWSMFYANTFVTEHVDHGLQPSASHSAKPSSPIDEISRLSAIKSQQYAIQDRKCKRHRRESAMLWLGRDRLGELGRLRCAKCQHGFALGEDPAENRFIL